MLDWAGYNMVQGRRPSSTCWRSAGEQQESCVGIYNGKPHYLSPPVHALATMPLWLKDRWVQFSHALLRLHSLVHLTAHE